MLYKLTIPKLKRIKLSAKSQYSNLTEPSEANKGHVIEKLIVN